MAKIARWFIDITLDSETLRWWSGTGDVTLGGETYTGLGTRFITPESLSRKASLKSEKIELEFDSSRQSDNADQIGYLLDQKWRNRAVRLRRLAWTAGQTADAGDVLADERGRIRDLSDSLRLDKPAIITMELESGALAYLERRRETRSSASQKAVYPGDEGFDLIATLEGRTLAWRTKHKKEGTVQYELNEEYEPQPREWVLGRFAKTGSFVAAWTNQQQNKSLVRVYAIADHRINKLDKVWINGELMISGALAHGVRTQINALNSGGARAWITFYDGRPDQVADSFQVAADGPWTSAHRLRGVAYVIMEHRWDSDLPNAYDYRFGGEGALLYDRRLDTTAGGSGSQRWDDPATWAYSTNAMVAIDHYRSGVRVNSGASALWFGVGEALDAVPYAEFEALADHCDEVVALKGGGTQKRYEVNGVVSAEQSHDKNLQALADQMAARAIDQGGRIAVRPPIIRASVVTLTDADLIRGSESTIKPGGKIDDMVNTLSGRFINPENDYKRDDYPAVQIAAYVDDDNGEISDTLNLDLENSNDRAQRIAKLRIEDSRRILELTETYGTKAKAIEPGEWFTRQSTIRGFPAGKIFVADEVTRYIDGSMEVVATEVDPDQLVWDEETAVDLSVPPVFPQLSLQDLETPAGSSIPRSISKGDIKLPGVDIAIAYGEDPLPYQTDIEVTRDDGTGAPLPGSEVLRRTLPAGATVATFGGELMPATDYVYRARSRFDGRVGLWSDWLAFTTPADYGVPASSAVEGSPLADALSFLDEANGATAQRLSNAEAAIDAAQVTIDENVAVLGEVGTRVTQVESTQDDQAILISAAQAKADEGEAKAAQALVASSDNAAAITAVDTKADDAQSSATQALSASQSNANAITQVETTANQASSNATLALQTANSASATAASVDAIARAGDTNTNLVPNGYFNLWQNGNLVPDGYSVWGGSGAFTRNASDQFGRYALKIKGNAGGQNGAVVTVPFLFPGKFIIRVRAALNEGNWDGAQVYGTFLRNDGVTNNGSFAVKLWSDPDTAGQSGATVGGYRYWDVEIDSPGSTVNMLLYLAAHSSANGGNLSVQNEIIFQMVELIPLNKAQSDAKLALQATQSNASAILSAQTTANNAQSSANSAQSAANTASSNASIALSTAQAANGTLSARGVFQLDVNGRITGIYLHSTGQQGTMKLKADAIQMFDGSSDRPLFTLSGGQIYMVNVRVGSLSGLSADLGTITAGVLKNSANTAGFNATLGVMVTFFGGFMYVQGKPFGNGNQFVEWRGSRPSGATIEDPKLSTLTTSNSVWYTLASDGKSYQGGNDVGAVGGGGGVPFTISFSQPPTASNTPGNTAFASPGVSVSPGGSYNYQWRLGEYTTKIVNGMEQLARTEDLLGLYIANAGTQSNWAIGVEMVANTTFYVPASITVSDSAGNAKTRQFMMVFQSL